MRQDARMRPIRGRNLDVRNTKTACACRANGIVAIGNAMLRSRSLDNPSPQCAVVACSTPLALFEQIIKFNIVYFYDVADFAPLLDEIMIAGWSDTMTVRPIGEDQGFILTWTRGAVTGETLVKSLDSFCGGDSFAEVCRRYHIPARVIDRACPADPAIAGVYRMRALLRAIRCDYREEFGIDPLARRIWTISGYAMQAYRKTLTKPLQNPVGVDSEYSHEMETFMRAAYRGAFVETRCDSQLTNLEGWDVNAEYPFATYALRMPTGQGYWTTDYAEWHRRIMEIPGFADVTIRSKHPTCITKRLRGGDVARTLSTRGVFTSLEILHALREGAKLVQFHRGLYFMHYDRSRSLQKFMQKCMRVKYATFNGAREAAKRVANVLTGKLGQKLAWPKSSIVYSDMPPEEGECEELHEGAFYKTIVHEDSDARLTFRAWVGWSALITAFGRIWLLEHVDATRSVYHDTDFVVPLVTPPSFVVNTAPVASAATVGYFTLRDTFPLVRFARKKCYAWQDVDGGVHARWAGFHAPSPQDRTDLLTGNRLPPRLPVPLDCVDHLVRPEITPVLPPPPIMEVNATEAQLA